MKAFILALTLLSALVLVQGIGDASAASLTQADGIAKTVAGDGAIVKVQGYGGGGADGGYSRRRGYDDDGHDRDYRGGGDRDRGWDPRGYREYCWTCSRRCEYGWCPPRCWGWRDYCRRDRYRD
jgi:hypothetical protein